MTKTTPSSELVSFGSQNDSVAPSLLESNQFSSVRGFIPNKESDGGVRSNGKQLISRISTPVISINQIKDKIVVQGYGFITIWQ